jgi:HSP20 family molecular chaperone IbpA
MTPAVDIVEDSHGITLLADVPGASRETVSIKLDDNVLTLEAAISLELPEDMTPLYTEMIGKKYARSFTLSRELDAQNIQAEVSDGVLKLHIPKSEAYKPRKIEINVENGRH